MSQSVNIRALQWAYERDGLSGTEKMVLVSFAMHADERGYSWPGVDHIAFRWRMDRKTVRRGIAQLLASGSLFPTKRRFGATGQVKVYRLPKLTWESGGKRTPFKKSERVPKEYHKHPISGGGFPPNNINNDKGIYHHHDSRSRMRGTTDAQGIAPSTPESGFVFGGDQNQNQDQPAQNHVKFPEFAAWCRSKGGTPSETGFWKWMCGQKPQWRNKVKKSFDQTGYECEGKFFTIEEANRLALEKPDLITKFRRAAMRDGRIQILQSAPL